MDQLGIPNEIEKEHPNKVPPISIKKGNDLEKLEKASAEFSPRCDTSPQIKAKSDKFEFTKPSKHELTYKRRKMYCWILSISYFLVTIALAILLEESHVLLALILLFNILFIFSIGVTAIRSIVFPFSF